jgi:anti-anti-sigma factor
VLEIATTDDPRGLRLAGEVDLATVNDLTAALEPLVREGGDITIDLTEVPFLGSSGVQVLIRALDTLHGRGRLLLANPGTSVRRLLQVMGLDRFENLEVRS